MNHRLGRAIRQILIAGTTAAFAASALASVGQQNPPPGPGQIPDYFGVVPNFANSPQPVLAQVIVNNALGAGASATATLDATGAITGFNNLVNGTGYVSPTVTITDNANGSGADITLQIDVDGTSTGTVGAIMGFTINNGGSGYGSLATMSIADPTGTGAALTPTIDPVTGAITSIAIVGGSGYTSPTVTVTDVAATGATATATSSGTSPGPNGTLGEITGLTVTAGGSGYHANPTVTIADAGTASGSGAVLVATTYDYTKDVQTENIMDIQVLNAGSGYDASTKVVVQGGPGVTPVTVTPIISGGTITGIAEFPKPTPAAGYTGLGSGFNKPIAGTGIRKFVDTLPLLDTPNNLGQQMPVAVADQATFPNSDYYEIAEVEYTQKLHSDLPPTRLRGYVQIKAGGFTIADFTAAADKLAYASTYAGYLGPVIVAQKDRAVRIKLVNLLPTGAAGKLPIPVDTTYMGADGPTDTDNRAALHLHGGNTPWISDGTPRQWVKPAGEAGSNKGETARSVPDMWFDTSGNVVPTTSLPADPVAAGLSNNPGDGALTFYYTNEQSARLMFYHDHAEGTTRLNVYAGVAAGYVLQDPTEQTLVANGTLPSMADTIPLVIQEKTFVPDDTTPVLNFYGPFKSQLNSQDPTWRWGTGTPVTGLMGNGDLWVPHVFMPNQNPGDVSGANAVGRWDYGAWFWPPFVNLQNGEIDNPYYDSTCNTTTSYCEGPKIPGVPNGSMQAVLSGGDPSGASHYPDGRSVIAIAGGVPDATNGGLKTESPSGTPEAFNDTSLVNGTAYPYINVDPKQYRLRILSVGNDRMLNLSMVVAASKNSVTTADANAGASGPAVLCDGTNTTIDPADCTEVKMVPFTSTQNTAVPFPAHWYTKQKGGVTFDGRPAGVFDPRTRGPQMVQIGTEGGFLSTPVAIPNQPVNYEYNPKNILIGNIKEHALLLGPAERADVLVDFSDFAGSTLILYNDAGAPVPAWDLRLDYYTGNFDNTDTGGAFSVIPGYGPNSRTLMQIRVSGTGGSHPADGLGTINMANLTTAVQTAFKTSQEPIIVPQSAYSGTYGIPFVDALGADLSRIGDHWLTYTPLDTTVSPFILSAAPPVKIELEPKTIIEDWTMNWGRMNALLGTEVPHTTAINQTSIPQAFIDPPTDLVKITPNDNMVPISGTLPDGTQIWKITHNGVDSHAIHFHLFHTQIVNRVGWDGAIYPPDANELGWKDTVRMNPLSDTIVALRPMTMNLPFKVPNSHRLIAPALPVDAASADFFNFNPLTGNASNVTNREVNYGWEYLWHCHILGHEENDMMRTIAVAQPPEAPSGLTATTDANGHDITLAWTDNSIISNWVAIQRSTDTAFDPTIAPVDTINVVETECNNQAGCPKTYTDTGAPVGTTVHYRIMANNTVGAGDGKLDAPRNADGSYGATLPPELSSLTPGFTGYANVTASSDWSGTASRLASPTADVTAGPLTFGNQLIGTSSAVQTVTVNNTGTGNLLITGVALTTGAPFAINNTCPASLAPAAQCTIDVTFLPTATGSFNDTLTITDNTGGTVGSTQTVSMSGTGIEPVAVVSSNLSFGDLLVGTTSAVQPVTLTNTGTAPLTVDSIVPPAQFILTNNCGATVAAGSSCTVDVAFKPTAAGLAGGNLVFTDNSNGQANSVQNVALSGNAVAPATPALSALLSTTAPATVNMTWNVSSTVAAQPDSYQVQRSGPSTNAALNCATAAYNNLGVATTTPSASDATVIATRNYCYRVVATNAAGTFTSAGVKVTTPAAPTAPTAAVFSSVSPTSLTFGWTASAGAVIPTGYEVQRCTGLTAGSASCTASWATVGTVTTNSYNATGLVTGTPYLFRVRALNGPMASGWLTSTVVAYPVAIADTFQATANGNTTPQTTSGNVLTNDLPSGANGRTVTNISAVTHTTGGGANPATATVTVNNGTVTLTMTSPAANNTSALIRESKRGTYTFTYTETYQGITTAPITVTWTVI